MRVDVQQITIPGSESVIIHIADVDVGKMPPNRVQPYIEQIRTAFETNNPILQKLNLNSVAWKVMVSAKRA